MAAVIIAIRNRNKKRKEAQYYGEAAPPSPIIKRISSYSGSGAGQGWRKYQPAAHRLYNKPFMQYSVAGLISANFLCNIIQAQIDPTGCCHEDVFAVFELFFNVVFLLELILNMYSVWFRKFWKSSWNVFDFFVVTIGWMFQLKLPLPGPLKLLRMMRAFRIFRLFKRVESLRKIMSSLAKAVPGVMNAFLIQLIIICIFAIIAVDRFREWGDGYDGPGTEGTMINEGDKVVELQTGRGQNYGFEYYGDFGKALYTMFQVLTGESWCEAVSRPLFNSSTSTMSMGACFFFVFFSILNGVVLINVVVAVLLEKMVDEPAVDESGEAVVNPVQSTVFETLEDVRDLKKKARNFSNLFTAMQKELSGVDIIKDQIEALLKHNGLKVEFHAPPIQVPIPPNGFHAKKKEEPASPPASPPGVAVWGEPASPSGPAPNLQITSPTVPGEPASPTGPAPGLQIGSPDLSQIGSPDLSEAEVENMISPEPCGNGANKFDEPHPFSTEQVDDPRSFE